MPVDYTAGMYIVAVGIVGVFANLAILMAFVKLLGLVFGKKPKKQKVQAS